MDQSSTEQVRVLHVDDEPDFADVTATYLEREDGQLSVETATSAGEGLERLVDTDFDCIVSDYGMPGQNGIEFLESVREDYPSLPFILFTGKGSEEVASDAISAGATDYLQKERGPDQYTVLANRIRNAVDQYHASNRAAELDRIRTLVSDVNQALVRAESRSDAETRICDIFSDAGPYRFAWIGEVDPDTSEIEPRASGGLERGYLDDITVTTDETATGHGPGGTAIRERRVAVAQNVRNDPDFEPWREPALDRGFQSVAAIPLEHDDTLYGLLAVYADRPYAFDDTERQLLAELGDDVAHGLHSFEVQGQLRDERDRRRDHADRLEQLHETTRELITADTRTEVAHVTADAVRVTLDYQYTVVRLVNGDGTALDPVAVSQGAESMLGERPTYPVGEGPVGRAYAAQEILQYDDVQTLDDGYDRRDARSGLYLPLGEYGTISINDPAVGAFDDTDIHLARILAANAETALDRIDRTRDLERTQTIIESSGDGVYALDADGRFTFVNDALVELTGYAESDLLGESVSILMDDDIATGESSIEELLQSDERTLGAFETDVVTASGDRIACEVHVSLLPVEDEFHGTTGIVRDITDRKERERALRRERDRFSTLFDSATDCIAYCEFRDDDPVIEDVNPAFEERFGFDADEIRGESLDETVAPPDKVDDARDISRRVKQGDQVETELQRRTTDGVRTFLHRAVPITTDGAVTKQYAIYTDITDRKERERELKRQNERLDEFASVVSHDLRNPLNVAQGRLELAREECNSAHLDTATDALERGLALVEDLLTLAQEGQRVSDVEPVAIGDVVERCWRNVETADATLVTETTQTLRADPNRLKQLLENLLWNAVDHGGDDVTVTFGDCDDGFYVADDGPGIPEDEREQVFDAGYSTADDGTGFGLNIVREIADAHEWDVRATDSETGGARVELTGVDTVS